MDLHLTIDPDGPALSDQIYRGVADAILDGRLRSEQRLPSSRALAEQLDVARTTVVYAYERLTAEGYVVSRRGAGTFVGTVHVRPASASEASALEQPSDDSIAAFWRTSRGTHGTTDENRPVTHDFRVGVPDASFFPLDSWRRLVARHLRQLPSDAGQYGRPEGSRTVRRAIARHIGVSRSVRCSADHVIVTRGAQQAFDLLARVLVQAGVVVAVEEPGYPPVREVFTSMGATVVGVPVDDEGIEVGRLPADARILYVTPSHQFPLGSVMSLERRTQLLDWADAHDAVVIEDDYDSEFRFQDRPLEPLKCLDTADRVAYVGTFSKTLLPSLRLGFLVPPARLLGPLHVAKGLADSHSDPTPQRALAAFLDSGKFAVHVRRSRRRYAKRHDQLIEGASELAQWLDVVPGVAGLHVSAVVRPGVSIDVGEVVRRARAQGVLIEHLDQYHQAAPRRDGIVLGYGAIQTEDITPGLDRLRRLIDPPAA